MSKLKNKSAAPKPRRSKDLFLEIQEAEFGTEVWDGEDEKPNQRKNPLMPMKFHSNKWAARI